MLPLQLASIPLKWPIKTSDISHATALPQISEGILWTQLATEIKLRPYGGMSALHVAALIPRNHAGFPADPSAITRHLSSTLHRFTPNVSLPAQCGNPGASPLGSAKYQNLHKGQSHSLSVRITSLAGSYYTYNMYYLQRSSWAWQQWEQHM